MTPRRTMLLVAASLSIAASPSIPAKAGILAPVYAVFGAASAALVAGAIYQASRPPMTELEHFIYWEQPAETAEWVHWQQKGSFAGAEGDTKVGRGLQLFRNDLRTALVERTRRMSTADFEARYGTDQAPNFCAISKEAIAATFAARYGEKAESNTVWKHSRCTP
jgi:hypothetical protein